MAVRILLILFVSIGVGHAQLDEYEPGPDNKLNSNVAITITAPLNPTANYMHIGWGLVYGAGYNFSHHHAFIGEIMWNRLYATPEAVAPIRTALNMPDLDGHADLVTLTANYRLQFQEHVVGAYAIGGAGMYYRRVALSQRVTVGNGITCTPVWVWWGFTCTAGSVTANQTLASVGSTTVGGNGGVGITFKERDSWWKVYIEVRYHYAGSKSVNTQVIPISVGVRF